MEIQGQLWTMRSKTTKVGSSQDVEEIRAYAKAQGILTDTKSARRHWSGLSGFIWDVMTIDHPLDGPVTLKHKKISYAVDYSHTSAYVHCSLPGLDNYYAEEMIPFYISRSSSFRETSKSTLFIILTYVHSAIAYALFGLGIDRPNKVDLLFQETLKKM